MSDFVFDPKDLESRDPTVVGYAHDIKRSPVVALAIGKDPREPGKYICGLVSPRTHTPMAGNMTRYFFQAPHTIRRSSDGFLCGLSAEQVTLMGRIWDDDAELEYLAECLNQNAVCKLIDEYQESYKQALRDLAKLFSANPAPTPQDPGPA